MRKFYINPTTTQKEQSHFETFLSLKNDLPIEKWEKMESPDYILYIYGEKIGLELTSLVDYDKAEIRSAQNKCLRKATELIKKECSKTVEVKLKFRSDCDPMNIDIAVRELVDFVKNKIPQIDDSKPYPYFESGLKYSKDVFIRLGTLNGKKWLSQSRFLPLHINWVRINPIEQIQMAIVKKQKKFQKYTQKCDECWLLIGVDEWTAPEAVAITEEVEENIFFGSFQRLFFLRNIEGHLVELKIENIAKNFPGLNNE